MVVRVLHAQPRATRTRRGSPGCPPAPRRPARAPEHAGHGAWRGAVLAVCVSRRLARGAVARAGGDRDNQAAGAVHLHPAAGVDSRQQRPNSRLPGCARQHALATHTHPDTAPLAAHRSLRPFSRLLRRAPTPSHACAARRPLHLRRPPPLHLPRPLPPAPPAAPARSLTTSLSCSTTRSLSPRQTCAPASSAPPASRA